MGMVLRVTHAHRHAGFIAALLASAIAFEPSVSVAKGSGLRDEGSSARPFVGTYDTNWGPVWLRLDAERSLVGDYAGPFVGTLEGTVVGRRYHFVWRQTNGEGGRGYFERTEDGIAGEWGGGESETSGGVWSGRRR